MGGSLKLLVQRVRESILSWWLSHGLEAFGINQKKFKHTARKPRLFLLRWSQQEPWARALPFSGRGSICLLRDKPAKTLPCPQKSWAAARGCGHTALASWEGPGRQKEPTVKLVTDQTRDILLQETSGARRCQRRHLPYRLFHTARSAPSRRGGTEGTWCPWSRCGRPQHTGLWNRRP